MKKYYYIFIFCIIILLVISLYFKLRNANVQIIISKEDHVLLTIDKSWVKDNSLVGSINYKGKDGFIKIGAITGENLNTNNIDNMVKETVNDYSIINNCKIISLKIDSQDARLIIPTNNGSTKTINEYILLIKYPANIEVRTKGILFNYLEIQSDKKHMKNISKSIKFIH